MRPSGICREIWYPLGYPLQIETESPAVLATCRDAWGHWPRLFDVEPLRLRVWVGGGAAAVRPQFFVERGAAAYVADKDNCGGFRTGGRLAWLRVSEKTALNYVEFRYHFLEALALTLLDTVAFTPIHAACISRANRAVLLCGDSGAGKSSLAYLAATSGWTFVSDDAVHVVQGGTGGLVGNPYKLHLRAEAKSLFRELSCRAPRSVPNGKTAIEISTAVLSTKVQCGPVAACVFLRRRPGRTRILPHPAHSALEYFSKYAWWPRRAAAYLRLPIGSYKRMLVARV